MGLSFGSVHFRTGNSAGVRAAAEAVAKARRTKFLLAPARGGWVTVYPKDAGQDEAVAEALAKKAKGDVVYVGLHDSDVFFYAAWRDGKKLDAYNSCPDYFGDVASAAKRRLRGKPAALVHLLPAGVTADDLRSALEGDPYAQATYFARRLGLPGAWVSYEDLMRGDVPEELGLDRDSLVHVPDLGPELRRLAEAAARADSERQRLRAEGLLLLDEPRSAVGQMFQAHPLVCAGSGPAEFLCAWSDYNVDPTDPAPLLQYATPFAPGGTPVSALGIGGRPSVLATSPDGRHLAVGCAGGNWTVELWDLHERRRVAHVPQERAVRAVGFSAGGRDLLSLSEGVLTVVPVGGGPTRALPLHRQALRFAAHPRERVVVSNEGQDAIRVTDLDSGEVVKTLSPPEDLIWVNEGALQIVLEVAKTSGAKAADLRVHEQYMREAMKAGMLPGGPSNQLSALAFTADGTRLLAGTYGGVRVYDWQALLKAPGGELPPARFEAGAIAFVHEFRGNVMPSTGPVYCFVHDQRNDRAVYCENAGVVRSLDLKEGTVRDVARPPGPGSIVEIALSRDGTLLAFGYRPGYEDSSDPTPYRLQVWDYARIVGSGRAENGTGS